MSGREYFLGEPGDLACRNVVHRRDDLELLGINECLDDRAALGEARCRQAGIRFGDLLHQDVVVRIAMTVSLGQGGECWLEVLEQYGNVAKLDIIDRTLDCTA